MNAPLCRRLGGPARRAVILAVAFAAALPLAGSRAAGPVTVDVDIAKFAFVPKEITVAPGTRVRWTNHDETPHTVTSRGATKLLSSPGLDIDDRYEFVFTADGDFAYFCTVHPMMTATVHVRKDGAKAP